MSSLSPTPREKVFRRASSPNLARYALLAR